MTLQETIREKIEDIGADEVLNRIGIQDITPKARERLSNLVNDRLLGINKSFFDFKYSNIEYIKAVCKALNINFNDYKSEYAFISGQASAYMSLKSPCLFIETDFIRSGQPIFMLAFLEQKRRIELSKELILEGVDVVIEYSKKIVKNHFLVSGRYIEFWGTIKHYVLIIDGFGSIKISVEGEVVSINQCKDRHANLIFNNHELVNLIKIK